MLRRLILAVAATLITAVLAEIGFRVYASASLPEYTSQRLRERATSLRDEVASATGDAEGEADEAELPVRVPHPYLGWIGTPGMVEKGMSPRVLRKLAAEEGTEWIDEPRNNAGFISPYDVPYIRQPGDFVVLVVGGSVARWFAILGDETFERALRRDARLAARNVVLVNAAMSGFKQPQQVMSVAFHMVMGVEPDVIINLDGFNDVCFASENVREGVDAAFPALRYWSMSTYGSGLSREMTREIAAVENARAGILAAVERAERFAGLSNILAYTYMKRAERHEAAAAEHELRLQAAVSAQAKKTQAAIVRGPRGGWKDVDEEAAVLDVWERSSRLLESLCSAEGIEYLHVLQPTPHDWAGGHPKVFTPFELEGIGPHDHPLAQVVEAMYPKLRERGKVLVADGVDFIDLSPMFADYADAAYYDLCHLTFPANQVLGERLAKEVLDRLPPE